jgi:hypothetical protein
LSWVKGQAAPFPRPFFLFEGYELIKKNIFVSFQYFFFIFLIILLLIDGIKSDFRKLDDHETKKYFFIFLLILFLFFHNKGISFLTDSQIYNFFVNSFYYIFRSSDKVIIYYPFITLVIIVILTRSYNKKIYVFLFFLILNSLISYPLITGNLKTKYDLTVGENANFTESEYSMIKKYTNDYKSVVKLMNKKNDEDKFGILNLPFTGITSPNWSNYVKNQHVGYDPYTQFFKHKIFSLNNWSTKEMDFIGREWNLSKPTDDWFKKIFKLFPTKYLLLHKDTFDFLYEESLDKIKVLEKENIIDKVFEGDQLILYEIKQDFSNEIIYLPSYKIKTSFQSHKDFSKYLNSIPKYTDEKYIIEFGDINYYHYNELINNEVINKKINIKEKNLINNNLIENYKNDEVDIRYEKIHDTLYEIELSNLSNKKITIGFLQTFSKFWKLKLIENNNDFEFINHFKCNGYANCFDIKPKSKNLKLIIQYSPQLYVDKIMILMIILLIISFLILVFFRKRDEN